MLVFIVGAILAVIAIVIGWYLWRMFGSFKVENQVAHDEQSGALERLAEAQEELLDATDRLTHELELLKMGVRGRR